MTQAFVYKWTHLPSFMWYIGSRTKKNCHPNDGYICSSKVVEPMINANPHEWEREIVAIGEPDEMYELETEILQTFDAKNDPMSFNKHNGDGKFTMAGKKQPPRTKEHNEKIRQARTGVPREKKTCEKIRQARTGVPRKPETCSKISEKQKGVPQPKITCPHCNVIGGRSIMKRYHFNRCTINTFTNNSVATNSQGNK